jgi:hypothetical protein
MTNLSYVVPVAGTDLNSVADPQVSTALTAIRNWAAGNIDGSNIATSVYTAIPQGIVTSIPGGPTDGQIINFLADSTNGVVWQLRYRAASASTYKWEFIGGSALYAEVQTNETTTSITYTNLTTSGPALTLPTLPNGGDFDVTVGANIGQNGSTATWAYMSYAIGATAAVDADAAYINGNNFGSAMSASVVRTRRKTGLSSATTLTAKYHSESAGVSSAFASRYMSIVPVRVG